MQEVLCPSCGTLVATKAAECPQCGTSLYASAERTHVRGRSYEDLAGRTLDNDSEEEPVPFEREKSTQPHPAVRRHSVSGLPISDQTLPFRSSVAATVTGPAAETGPALDSVAATIVPPPPSSMPTPINTPAASSPRRVQLRPLAPTERAPAIHLSSAVTPQVLERIALPETQPGIELPKNPPSKKDPLIGTQLGEYTVEERVGIGGMGIVYRAVQPLIGNSVAIKVLRPDVIATEDELQRFLGEARTVNSIRHRSIISIFGAADTPDGRKYLVMEYLEGESLETRLQREGRLTPAEVLPILEDVLSALAAAHAANVVHRDLKPANVFLVHQSDGRPWVKLLDFGLARSAKAQDVSRVAGTPDYISPEHALGKPAGPPADLYAFGIMAFHLLTGRLPFTGNTPIEVMEQHVHKPPPSPAELNPDIPSAMSELILRLLDKTPQNRPDAKTVKADLKAAAKQLRSAQTQVGISVANPNVSGDTVLRGPPTAIEEVKEVARPDPRLQRLAMEADRSRQGSWLGNNWPWLAGGIALVWLLTVALYLLLQRSPLPDTRERPIDQPREELPAPRVVPVLAPPDTTGEEPLPAPAETGSKAPEAEANGTRKPKKPAPRGK